MAKMIINGEVYSGSTNYASAITYIKEDGTKSTVQKELDSRPVNNNLLINSNFANPVNQRGFSTDSVTTVETYKYTIDRWYITRPTGTASPKLTLGDGYVTLSGTKAGDGTVSFCQKIGHMPNGAYTVSAKVNGNVYSATFDYTGSAIAQWHADGICLGLLSSKGVYIATHLDYIPSANIEWVKLELGEVATPYVSRLYEEELELCQRYYQIIHNNLFPWSATTSDMVFHQHFKPMRITPTISIIEAAVYLDNQKQSGFKFRTDYKTNRRFNLYATKSSHGLKSKAYVGLFLNVALDAEL